MAEPLRRGLEPVIDDVIDSVARAVPQYNRPTSEPEGRNLQATVRAALQRLLDLLGTRQEPLGPAAALYRRIGAAEYRAQRPLEAVQTAYRVGALASWRGFSALATAAGADAVTTARLAEACFTYIDEISSASAAGYAAAQAADAGRREAMHAELVAAVIDPARAGQVPQLAEQADWQPPARLVVAVWGSADRIAGLPTARIGEATVALLGSEPVGRLGHLRASLGTPGPLAHAPVSYRQALSLAALRRSGALRATGAARAEDHLAELLLAADPALAEALVTSELAAIDHLSGSRRDALVDTAALWLLHGGSRSAVARDLHVHPQTVSYRMESVRAAFGEQLASPEARWRLLLALRAEQQARASR